MRDVPGYEGIYAVTETGEVWSYPRRWKVGSSSKTQGHNGKWLKPSSMSAGYLGVSLSKPGFNRCFAIHRIVAWAYVPKIPGKPYVNHIDNNHLNNHYTNLEWVTPSENTKWSAKNGSHSRVGKSNGRYKYPPEIVKKAVEMHNEGIPTFRISKTLGLPNTLTRFYISGRMRSEDSGVKPIGRRPTSQHLKKRRSVNEA